MLLVSYDISSNKLRTRFSKYLEQYGHRLQYSLFEIRNSKRILKNIQAEIEGQFEKQFSQEDSIMVFSLSKNCVIHRYGYAKNDETDLLIV